MAIAAAGAPLTAQAMTIMNKTVNAGIATPVAAVANYAGDKSGATIYTNAGGSSVQSINLPAVDTATPLTSATSAPSSSAEQGTSITPPPSTTGAQSTQTSSTGGTQNNLSQAMTNFYLALSQMSEAQFTQFQNELNNMSISSTGELIVSPTTPTQASTKPLAQATSGGNGAKKAGPSIAASAKSNVAKGGAVALVDGVLLAGITKIVKEEVLKEMKTSVMNAFKKQLTDGINAARDALKTDAANASSTAAAITEQEPVSITFTSPEQAAAFQPQAQFGIAEEGAVSFEDAEMNALIKTAQGGVLETEGGATAAASAPAKPGIISTALSNAATKSGMKFFLKN